jgi:hypothetical protein
MAAAEGVVAGSAEGTKEGVVGLGVVGVELGWERGEFAG